MESIICPRCSSGNIKLNGHTHNGKQNYRCKICGREFVPNPEKKFILEETKSLIKKLLLERIPLRGICRVTGVSLSWLLGFIAEVYEQIPEDLGIRIETIKEKNGVIIKTLKTEQTKCGAL